MRRTALFVPLAVAGLLLAACGDDDDPSTTPTETEGGGESESTGPDTSAFGLIDDGTLTVCSDVPYEPFEFEDADCTQRLQRLRHRPHADDRRRPRPRARRERPGVRRDPVRRGARGRPVRRRRVRDDDHRGARGEHQLHRAVLRRRPVALGQGRQRVSRASTTSTARRSASRPTPLGRRTPSRTPPTG